MSCYPDAFTIGHYTILTSLSGRTIYIKLTDNIGYVCYETHVEANEFHLSLPAESIYQLITQCFAEDTGYTADISVSGKTMAIRFRARVNHFISFDFQVHIKEKLITSDGQLTMSFNRLEERIDQAEQHSKQQCANVLATAEHRITETLSIVDRRVDDALSTVDRRVDDALSTVDRRVDDALSTVDRRVDDALSILDKKTAFTESRIKDSLASVDHRLAIALATVDCRIANTMVLETRVARLEYMLSKAEIAVRLNSAFVQLGATSLSIPADNYLKVEKLKHLYNLQSLAFSPMSLTDLSGCVCPTVKELYLDGGGTTNFRSIAGIHLMPNLESLTIVNALGVQQISELFPVTHKIKYLRIKGCAGINIEGLSIYCRVNHIEFLKT
jgi:hypothetical protein